MNYRIEGKCRGCGHDFKNDFLFQDSMLPKSQSSFYCRCGLLQYVPSPFPDEPFDAHEDLEEYERTELRALVATHRANS